MMNAERLISDPIENYPHATVACFDPTAGDLPRRRLDLDRLTDFLARLEDRGADGLLIGASTGQGHLRTVDELHEWFKAASAGLTKSLPIALLRPEDGVDASRSLVQTLSQAGYPVVFIRPGTDLSPHATPSDIARNIRPVFDAIGEARMAIGLYSISDVSGVPLDPETVVRLLDSPFAPSLVAIKVTEASYEQSTKRFLDDPRLSHLKIVQGWDPHLARALRDGVRADGPNRVGVTSGPMSFAIDQYRYLLDMAQQDQWVEVAQAQAAVDELFRAMQDDPQRFADLQRAKYVMGLGHPLTGEVTREQVGRLMGALQSVSRRDDQRRLAASLNLMEDGPFREPLADWAR